VQVLSGINNAVQHVDQATFHLCAKVNRHNDALHKVTVTRNVYLSMTQFCC